MSDIMSVGLKSSQLLISLSAYPGIGAFAFPVMLGRPRLRDLICAFTQFAPPIFSLGWQTIWIITEVTALIMAYARDSVFVNQFR